MKHDRMKQDPVEVRAAGCVVWTRHGDDVRFAVVHRPRYDDWSFPKGKVDPGESLEEAALREVSEETGLSGILGSSLPTIHYRDDRNRPKSVSYWLLGCADDAAEVGAFEPNDEVDELRWLSRDEAAAILSYRHDVALLTAAAEQLGAQAAPPD